MAFRKPVLQFIFHQQKEKTFNFEVSPDLDGLLCGLSGMALPVTVLHCNADAVLNWLQRHLRKLTLFTVVVSCDNSFVVHLFEQVSQKFLQSLSAQWLVISNTDFTAQLASALTESFQVATVIVDKNSTTVFKSTVHGNGLIRFEKIFDHLHLPVNAPVYLNSRWSSDSVIACPDFSAVRISSNAMRSSATSSTSWTSQQPNITEFSVPAYTPNLKHKSSGNVKATVDLRLFRDPNLRECHINGRHLIMTGNNYSIFLNQSVDENNAAIYDGIDVKIMNILGAKYNFTYPHLYKRETLMHQQLLDIVSTFFNDERFEVVKPPDGQYGGLNPDGTVTGTIGMVARYSANVGIEGLTISHNRFQVVDFTSVYFFNTVVILSKAPGELPLIWTCYRTFSGKAWLCLFLAMVVLGPIASCFSTLSGALEAPPRRLQRSDERDTLPSVWDYTFSLLRSLLLQGNTMPIRGSSVLFFFGSCYFSFIIVQSMYSGALTAAIASPPSEAPIDCLEDLLRARDTRELKLKQMRGTTIVFQLQILSGEFACFIDLTSLYYYILYEDLKLFHVGHTPFQTDYIAFALPKGAPYRPCISELLHRLVDAGIVQHLVFERINEVSGYQLSNHQITIPKDPTKNKVKFVSLEHLAGAFIVLAVGLITASTALFFEIILAKKNKTELSCHVLQVLGTQRPQQALLVANDLSVWTDEMLPALFSVALPATLLTCNSTTVLKWLQQHRLQFALFTVVVACSESFVVDVFQQVAQHHLLAATGRWVVVAHADFSSRLAQVLSENIQVGFMVLDNRQRVVLLRNELMDDDSIKFVEVSKDNTGVTNCIFEDDLTWSGKVNTAAEINTVNSDDQHLIPELDLCCHAIHKFNKRAKLYVSSINFHESQEKHKPTYQLSEVRKKNKPTLCLDRLKASGLKGFACNRGYQNPMKDSTHLYQDPQWNGCCLSGRHLRIACNKGDVFMERRLDENNKEYYSGVDVDIIKIIAAKLNFSFEIFQARDQQFGNLEANGSITGIIGNRNQVVEFTSPYFCEPTVIVSKAAAPNAVIWTIYRPFTAAAWLSVLPLVLVIGPVAAGLARLSSARHSSSHHSSTRHSSTRHCKTGPASPSYRNQRPPGIADYTFGLLRSLLLQGNTLPVRGLPLCIFIGGCYFSFIVIQTSYFGALTAVIAAPSYEPPIDSLEDLLKSHYRKGTKLVQLPGTSFDNQVKTSEDKVYKALAEMVIYIQSSWDMKNILSGRYARIAPKSFVFSSTYKFRKDIHISRQTFYPQYYGYAVPQAAPYKECFSQILQRLVEAGIVNHLVHKRLDQLPGYQLADHEMAQPNEQNKLINLEHLTGAVIVILVGHILALMLLVIEIMVAKI
ncbi:Solute-binding protein family 3/N-terminal domain of MltF [Trinorchestia longiramus]|nr:Solute-binding protein family 3/N-terminal domain of MltF [Trinorchestia longiramus]